MCRHDGPPPLPANVAEAQEAMVARLAAEWNPRELLEAMLAYDPAPDSNGVPGGRCCLDTQATIAFQRLVSPRFVPATLLSCVFDDHPEPEATAAPVPFHTNQASWLRFATECPIADPTEQQAAAWGRCLGAVYASVLGDGIGHHTEFNVWNKDARPLDDMPEFPIGQFLLRPGQFTDDSSMALCLLDNLSASFGKAAALKDSAEFRFDAIVVALFWPLHCIRLRPRARGSIHGTRRRRRMRQQYWPVVALILA